MDVFLSKSQILHLHQRLIDLYGRPRGLRDKDALDSALARPQSTFSGEDLYPTLAEKAAALLHSLVSNRPFLEGNQRLGRNQRRALPALHGLELVASDEDLEELVRSSARGELVVAQIAIWLDQRLSPLR